MITLSAALSVLAGALMIASKTRGRFPCFVGGCAAILAGGFTIALPFLGSAQLAGWLWFYIWIASLPILLACVIALGILCFRDRRLLAAAVLGLVASISNIAPTLSFFEAVGLGVVSTNPNEEGEQDADGDAEEAV